MSETRPGSRAVTDHTPWSTRDSSTVRVFLRTEASSSAVLVAAIGAALVWANVGADSYVRVWSETAGVHLGGWQVSQDLRSWVNSGLMALFFLVIGLEARREFDLGDLRDRRRMLLPLLAGLAGMVLPIAIYLLVNLHSGAGHGWGVAMSTDTALSLGLLSLLGRDVPGKVRVFLLTVFVVDDLASLGVITVAYSQHLRIVPLVVAVAAFAALMGGVRLGVDRPAFYVVLGLVVWTALLKSGVDPVVTGLAIGLTASAYSPARESLEQATGLFRRFREQPTAELARIAATGLTATLSPNARLQRVYHPWTGFVIVPLFALANAGIQLDGAFLVRAYQSPITLGVIGAYVIGKPVAVTATSWLVARATGGRIRPAVGWAAVAGSGTIAGIGFTVSFLIAALAFHGQELAEAKVGVLSAGVLAAGATWVLFRVVATFSESRRARLLLGTAEQIVDLLAPVDDGRDHIRGPADASVTIVEYGDFQCPYCGRAEPAVRQELQTDDDVRFVWRHLPLPDVHPDAQLAAEATEAAAVQGAFWPMHDLLLQRQDALQRADLIEYAAEIGLDLDRFQHDLQRGAFGARVAADVEAADLSNVSGTPTFFVNGQRHYGAYDLASLTAAVRAARDRASLGGP